MVSSLKPGFSGVRAQAVGCGNRGQDAIMLLHWTAFFPDCESGKVRESGGARMVVFGSSALLLNKYPILLCICVMESRRYSEGTTQFVLLCHSNQMSTKPIAPEWGLVFFVLVKGVPPHKDEVHNDQNTFSSAFVHHPTLEVDSRLTVFNHQLSAH